MDQVFLLLYSPSSDRASRTPWSARLLLAFPAIAPIQAHDPALSAFFQGTRGAAVPASVVAREGALTGDGNAGPALSAAPGASAYGPARAAMPEPSRYLASSTQSSMQATTLAPPASVVSLHFGSRTLDDDVAWAGLEDQATFGMEYSTRGPSGFGFDLGLFLSTDTVEDPGTGIDVTGSLLELDFGGRYTYAGFSGAFERLHPYVQGGLALVAATIEAESGGIVASDEDGSLGVYLGGGAYAVLGTNFLLGIDARVLTGSSIELVGISTDADFSEVTVFLGWGF